MLYISCFLYLIFITTFINSISIPTYTKIINGLTDDCNKATDILNLDYDSLITKATYKFQFVTLTHFVDNEKLVYNLTNAHSEIVSSSKYNRNFPMVIIIHGYLADTVFLKDFLILTKAVKQIPNANVFVLDAGVLYDNFYLTSATYTIMYGEKIGTLLADLYFNGIRNFHLIGHSLGAHVSGIAGKKFESLTSVKLDRITGLDTAKPCFKNAPTDHRLAASDAEFVDVIHTNGGIYGLEETIGHIDFYPNGGKMMPGCLDPICSHATSLYYFIESISLNNLLAVECSDWEAFENGECSNNPRVVMGYNTPTDTPHGKYFLKTGSGFRKGLGENGIV